MLKVDFAKVSWGGPKIILNAEVSTLLHSMIKNGVFTPEEIDDIVVNAKKTDKQVAEEAEAARKEASLEQVAFADMATELMELLMKLGD